MCIICGNVGEVPNDIQIRFDLLEEQKSDLWKKSHSRTDELIQIHDIHGCDGIRFLCGCDECEKANTTARLKEQEDSVFKKIEEALQKIDDEQSSFTPFYHEDEEDLVGEILVPVILNDDPDDNPAFGKTIFDLPPGEERSEANSQILCAHIGGNGNITDGDEYEYGFVEFFADHIIEAAQNCCWSCIEELAVPNPDTSGLTNDEYEVVIVKMVDPCYTCGSTLYDYPGKTWNKVQGIGYGTLQCSQCQVQTRGGPSDSK